MTDANSHDSENNANADGPKADGPLASDPSDGDAPAKVIVTRRGVRTLVVVAAVCIAGLGAGVYAFATASKPVVYSGACAQSLTLAQAVDPLVHGEVAALALATRPNQLGPIAFDDGNGAKTNVAAFGGKTILLNLWATWCVPCRQEMPALDKLQATLGSTDFSVVAIDIDTTRLDRPKAFLAEIGAKSLPFYTDNTAGILQALKRHQQIQGLPTTILIGRDGCEIGTMAGPAVWDSQDAKALIEALKKAPKGEPS